MAKQVANVDILTETFEAWVLRTNTILDALSNEIVTANSVGGVTGNVSAPRIALLYGQYVANSVVATDFIRGGNSSVTNTLYINSAATATGNVTLSGTLQTIEGNVNFDSATLFVDATNNRVGILTQTPDAGLTINSTANVAGAFRVGGNTTLVGNSTVSGTLGVTGAVTGSNTITITGLASLNGGVNTTTANSSTAVNVGANVNINTSSVAIGNNTVRTFANSTAVSTSGTLSVTNIATFANNVTVGGTLGVNSTATLSNTLNVTGATVLANNASVGGTLGVNSAASFSNTVTVTGNTTLGKDVIINTDYVMNVTSNTNIGSNSTARVIYSFPKASYRMGKLMVAANNTNGVAQVNQMAEMVISHNNDTTAHLAVYGIISTPYDPDVGGAPLGTFTAQINSANVEILMNQTYSNSAVKVVAHLIK